MRNLESLIPKEIAEIMNLNRFDVEMQLISTQANGIYPKIRVKLDELTIADMRLSGDNIITYKTILDLNTSVNLKIEYYDRSDKDTVTVNGKIIEDQSITIKRLLLNDVDIVKSNTIYALGKYVPSFSQDKINYFKENNIEYGPSDTLTMMENGIRTLQLQVPLLPQLIQLQTYHKKLSSWPNDRLINNILDEIDRINN